MEPARTFIVPESASGRRLDIFLAGVLEDSTRSYVKGLIDDGRVTVDGKHAKAGLKLKGGETVSVTLPPPLEIGLRPEPIPLDIIYEDEDIIIVNKPPGMAVHPGAGVSSGTLVNALLHHTDRLSTAGGPDRPGIVHRLDKDTTGVLAVAKNDYSHGSLARQFKEHSTDRIYLALVWGSFRDDEGTIDVPIGRDVSHRKKISTRSRKKREAVTHYKVVKRFGLLTLVELMPETGRTHQIRVHLAAINHPVAGDPLYCGRRIPPALPKAAADCLRGVKRQLLHARLLALTHPSKGSRMEFTAPMPPDMERAVKVLEETCSRQGTE